MLLLIELLFIILLVFLLIMLNKNERLAGKSLLSHAFIEECWDGKNRRKYARFRKELDVIYAFEKKLHLKNNGKTVDISEGGAKLLLDKKFSKGDILDLKLDIPNAAEAAEIEGRVVWSEEIKGNNPAGKRLFHTGIEFSAIKEPRGMSLVHYIRSLAGEP